jgi:hypothetical protein
MPTLAAFKCRVGQRVASASVVAEATQTTLYRCMPINRFAGLALNPAINVAVGWW